MDTPAAEPSTISALIEGGTASAIAAPSPTARLSGRLVAAPVSSRETAPGRPSPCPETLDPRDRPDDQKQRPSSTQRMPALTWPKQQRGRKFTWFAHAGRSPECKPRNTEGRHRQQDQA